MNRFIFTFILLLFASMVKGQIVNNKEGNLYDGNHFFNEEFIKANKIAKAVAVVSVKKEMQPIQETGQMLRYLFEDGQLKSFTKTYYYPEGTNDTNSIIYQYDDIKRLVGSMERKPGGFEKKIFSYDALGNLLQEEVFKGENLSSMKYSLNPGKEFFLRKEQFELIEIDSSKTLINFFNSEGNKYKYMIIIFNSLGLKTEETSFFTISGKSIKTKFMYNDLVQLQEVQRTSDIGSKQVWQYIYTYQPDGNVYDERTFKDGKLLKRREFVYDSNTGLLVAELVKTQISNEIKITQFKFYREGEEEEEIIRKQDNEQEGL